MAIYIKGHTGPITIEKILNLLTSYPYITSCINTYSDIECNNVQCWSGHIRSINDIAEIYNTYNETEIELIDVLKEIYNYNVAHPAYNGKNIIIGVCFCTTIDKIVLRYNSSYPGNTQNLFYNMFIEFHVHEPSLDQLLDQCLGEEVHPCFEYDENEFEDYISSLDNDLKEYLTT